MPFGSPDNRGFGSGMGGGFGQRREPPVTAPYMPSQEQVDQARVEQDKPALFWRALQLPNRLLGGQMVTGFLEGTAKGGIGEGLLEGFLNNPLFQISDGMFGTHITKDVNFADVRKAFGDNDAEEGVANFFINTVGDILSSPLELMWSPFAKIVKATEGASAFAKGEANFGAGVFKHMVANTPAGLAASVAGDSASPVRRVLMAFKVPFTETGFAFRAPVNLDLYTAKVVDGMVGWMNTNPATSAVLNLFTRARLAVKDPEQRAIADAAKGAGDVARREGAIFFPELKKIVDGAVKDGLALDAKTLEAITLASDLGYRGSDDAAAMLRAIEDGPQVALAKRRTIDLIEGAERRGAGGVRDIVYESQRKLARDLEVDLRSSDPERVRRAFDRWIADLPDARLPESFLQNPLAVEYQSRLRPGVDLAPHEYKPVDLVLSNVEGKPVTSAGGIVTPGATDTGAAGRAADIVTGEPLPSEVMRTKYRATAKDLIEGIIADKGLGHMQKIAAVGQALKDLSRRIGLGEQVSSVLTTAIEQYLPRSLDPEMRKLIGAAVTDATKGRVNLESTMMELNLWAENYGTRLTNYRTVTLNGDNGTSSVMEVLSKILPEDLMKKLKAAGQAGDTAAGEAFEFMSTNPFYTMHRRIEQHLNLMEKAAFHKAIDESPLIIGKTKIGEATKNYEHMQQGRVGVVVNKTRMQTPGQAMKHGELVDDMFQVNNRARYMQSRQDLMDYFSDEVEHIESRMRARGEEPTVATVEQAVREHREAIINSKPNDWDENLDVPNKAPVTQEMRNTKFGQLMQRFIDITQAAEPETVKGKTYWDPIVGDVNPVTDTLVEKQKVMLHGDTPEAATAQVHTKTTTTTDNPSRHVKRIPITKEYAESAVKRYRVSYFNEQEGLKRAFDAADASVQYWGDKLASLDEGVRVHVPMSEQGKGAAREATTLVTNSAPEEAAVEGAKKSLVNRRNIAKNLKAEAKSAGTEVRNLAKSGEARLGTITAAQDSLRDEIGQLSYRLVEDPKELQKQLDRVNYLMARIENLGSQAESVKSSVVSRTASAAARGEALAPAAALSQEEVAKALESLKEAKQTLSNASKPLDEIRGMVAKQWVDLGKEKADYFRQVMERRQGIQALDVPQKAADVAAGMLDDADKAYLAAAMENPFTKAAVAEQWAFDMAGRRSEAKRLYTLIGNEREATKETLARFRAIVGDLTGSLKAAKGDRIKLIKDIVNRDPHGAEMIDELHILLRQEKNGTLPLQELDGVFERRAALANERRLPGSPEINAADLKKAWFDKHADTEIHWYDPTVHEGLYGSRGMWNQMFGPTTLARTWPVFDRITSWWKSSTVMAPWAVRSRVRDVMTTQLSVSAGTGTLPSAAAHGAAYKVAKTVAAALEGDFTAAKQVLVDLGEKGTTTAEEIIQAGQRTGALNGTLARDELGVMGVGIAGVHDLASQEAGIVSKFINPDTAGWAKLGARNMEFLDNHAKLATAIAYARQKGTTIEEAFNAIKPWVYDPGRADLSNAERYIFKKLIPFYSYQKFAIGSVMKAAFQKPSTMSWWEKAHNNANRMMGMTDLEMQSFMPEFIGTNLGIPVEKRPDGVYVKMFGNFLPFAEVTRLATTVAQTFDPNTESGIKDYLGGNLNPAIRVPVEWITNRSFYTQKKVAQFEGQEGEMFGIPMSMHMKNALSSIRALNELDQLNVFNFGDLTKLMSLGDAVERRQYANTSFWEKVQASSLNPNPFGKPYFLSSEMQARVAMGKAENEVSQLKHQMKVQIEKGSESTRDVNLQKLQALMADKMARLQAIDTAAKKLGLTKDRRGDYHAPTQ